MKKKSKKRDIYIIGVKTLTLYCKGKFLEANRSSDMGRNAKNSYLHRYYEKKSHS